MSLINVTTPEKNVRELEFSVERAVFDKACNAAYKRNVGKMNIPGFRKGKAPRSIIEKMYGEGCFYEEALNAIIPDAYEAALKESELKDIVSRPEFDVKTIDENGVVLLAKVYVKPEVVVKDYKGIAVTSAPVVVTDEAIDAEIEKLRQRNSREIEVTDRAAQMGDSVVFDFDGSVDGVAFDGGKSENYNLKLGSGQFIPGFEEQIVGKSIGEAFDVNVTFPEDYHAAELAGKAAVFACKLHEIKEIELPELDDEFVKDVSEFDTLDAYKADLKAKMEEQQKKVADNAIQEQLIANIVENMECDIPQPMIENEVENQVRDFDMRLRQQGMDLKTYFKYTGLDLDGMREQFAPMAERQVKARLALEGVVAAEGIVASEEEIAAEYDELAKAYGMDVEEVKKYIDDDSVSKDICVRKAIDLVKEAAVITEAAEEASDAAETVEA